jgi:DNA-binding NarL/FixJ family response regulator
MDGKFQRLKTVVVEDSTRMQQILGDAIQAVAGLELVAVVDTAAEAVACLEGHNPDIVIIDLVLRTGSGLDVLSALKRCAPNCRGIVFTGYDDEQYRAKCMAAGADDFFSKNREHRELVRLLNHLGGEAPVSFWDNPPIQPL